MQSVIIRRYGGPEVLEVADLPVPEPGPGQVLIRVAAAAVNPVDVQTRSGALTAGGLLPVRPVTGLGWDVAGVVDAVGTGVDGFAPGQRVLGLCDRLPLRSKAQAEFVLLDADAVAHAPDGLDLTAAATLPLGALTAAQSLDLAGLPAGGTVLVTGAAGSVGGYAVELAARAGLRVVATAGAGDAALARELGAEVFVPREADLAETVRALVPGGVDGVIDVAGVGVPALDAVRGGGVFVALLGGAAPPALRGIRVSNVWIRADGARLAELATMGLRTRIAGTLPLSQVAAAHEQLERGGLRGRLVLLPGA
jgi:NADPH:quinone reductase